MRNLLWHVSIFLVWGLFLIRLATYYPNAIQKTPDELKDIAMLDEKWILLSYHGKKTAYIHIKPDNVSRPGKSRLHYFKFVCGVAIRGDEHKVRGKGYMLLDKDSRIQRARLDLVAQNENFNLLVVPKQSTFDVSVKMVDMKRFNIQLPYVENVTVLARKLLYSHHMSGDDHVKMTVLTEDVDINKVELEYPEIHADEKIINLFQGV